MISETLICCHSNNHKQHFRLTVCEEHVFDSRQKNSSAGIFDLVWTYMMVDNFYTIYFLNLPNLLIWKSPIC